LSGRHAGPGIKQLACAPGVFFKIEAVTDEAASAGIGNSIPDSGVGGLMTDFPGSAAMDDDLVATLNDENVFHGTTAADFCHINYRSHLQSCKTRTVQFV